ncbi:hypothetical protein JIG36_23065 [Actinoplanes sp. LDG1-06]|uniref:Secreted protein n=1 Tax=Paractinoplanes ovalisporus TaxID=2810368 RepID=A0ABS2AGE3_9ACTN|nr:hypothetical protein [Actinoplanes ovalisporus]MBM2618443.1 hypothetical protein [Actinoplanes ovalisporus]
MTRMMIRSAAARRYVTSFIWPGCVVIVSVVLVVQPATERYCVAVLIASDVIRRISERDFRGDPRRSENGQER